MIRLVYYHKYRRWHAYGRIELLVGSKSHSFSLETKRTDRNSTRRHPNGLSYNCMSRFVLPDWDAVCECLSGARICMSRSARLLRCYPEGVINSKKYHGNSAAVQGGAVRRFWNLECCNCSVRSWIPEATMTSAIASVIIASAQSVGKVYVIGAVGFCAVTCKLKHLCNSW